MLKGSLQTVALPEVLNFLADTGKSGEFHVSGSHGGGRLWFDHGRISGIEVTRALEPSEAIFELLRVEDGEFDFASDSERSEHAVVVEGDAGAVAPALEVAEAKLAEWRDIVAVVPSLEHGLQLRADTPGDVVTLEPDQWMMVVAIGAGRSVAEVIDARQMQEFDGCKAVRDLVEASLVEVIEPAVIEPAVAVAPAVESPAFQPVELAVEPLAEVSSVAEESFVVDEPVVEVTVGEREAQPEIGFSPFGFSSNGDEDQAGSQEADHYAALRAAMVEIGDDLTPGEAEAEYEESHPVYEFHADPEMDGRAALQALLSEVTEDVPVDGLADRGPWTQSELSTMDMEHESTAEPEYEVSNIVPFASAHSPEEPLADTDGEAQPGDALSEEEHEDTEPAAEPINRGMLLKFLSSVRN